MSNPHAWLLSDLASVAGNGIKVMSTFACGGGSSMGYKRAGCTIIAANDIDPEMAWHYQKNLSPKHYFRCPIQDLLSADLPSDLFDLDILDGSPPCSTFSMAGSREKAWGKDKHFREGQAKQVLSDLFFDYLDLVERLRPKVAIAENVKGMIIGNAKGYTRLIMTRFRELGYRPQLFLVNAADCGVPQCRERVFFCAIRDDIAAPPLRLAPTHRWINCGEATSDLTITPDELREVAFTSNTDLVWWPKTHQGEDYGDAVKRTGQPVKLWNHKKLDANAPSLTLTATHAMIKHWKEPRCLTFREYARLGSFPDDYQVKSGNIGKYIIGMSVPPKMTEQVARAVIDQWL
jgi:DNA (cytosine-5)-methyltransferase 1